MAHGFIINFMDEGFRVTKNPKECRHGRRAKSIKQFIGILAVFRAVSNPHGGIG